MRNWGLCFRQQGEITYFCVKASERGPLSYPDGSAIEREELIQRLSDYGYQPKARAEEVTEEGDYYLAENGIRLIFLPAVYPVNGIAVSKDGRHVAAVTIRGKSGQVGARYRKGV